MLIVCRKDPHFDTFKVVFNKRNIHMYNPTNTPYKDDDFQFYHQNTKLVENIE